MKIICYSILILLIGSGCKQTGIRNLTHDVIIKGFPKELVNFSAYENNPVFKASGTDTWDHLIRERGWIMKEDNMFYMWYTGYRSEGEQHNLGLATSTDGINWTRYPGNPLWDSTWVEDMCVVKSDGVYYMFAEGTNDIAHLLTSTDRLNWKDQGSLDIRYTNGEPLTKCPYGTPSVIMENGVWYLFYEREDLGVWLAASNDLKVWKNKQDEPVLKMGPHSYDKYAVAFDQVIKYEGSYYAYYHASEYKDWHDWTSCIAKSDDLIHWKKYNKNPILRENMSSPLLVKNGEEYWLYSMYPEVCVHFSKIK
jgi:predicted GH43/DUF377 family glycosyl hydrolase